MQTFNPKAESLKGQTVLLLNGSAIAATVKIVSEPIMSDPAGQTDTGELYYVLRNDVFRLPDGRLASDGYRRV